jgi:ATP-dependent helicase HrpB
MAAEHSSPRGDLIGYHVRFDRRVGPRTRLLAVTPGILHDHRFLESGGRRLR